MKPSIILAGLLLLPAVAADTFTEDFEDYTITGIGAEIVPEQEWYDYSENTAIGQVSDDNPTVNDLQWMKFQGDQTTDATARSASFTLEVPAQLFETTFYVNATPIGTDGLGSRQVVSIQSSAPVRTMVEFYVLCTDATDTTGCDFNVRFEQVDTLGQTLIDANQTLTAFKVRVIPDWLNGTYNLFVNDVDDGWFPFLELPEDIGRIHIDQQRADVPLNMSFDDWQVQGATNGTGAVEGDVATGIQNFANNIHFNTAGSKFFLGILVFLVLCAAVIVPMVALGLDNTIVPAIAFFATMAALWLVYIEFWPDWVGIAMIIAVAALIGTLTRRLVLGIQDANQGPGLVAGSLGYFIIATSLLAFSGYATDTVAVPTGPAEQQGINETTDPSQSFLGAVAECVFTGGVFTFGLRGDCSQETVSSTWVQITDIFGWVRAGLNFLFQLLTFQLPIPVIFNVMIVLPPAAALATFAIMVIRGIPS